MQEQHDLTNAGGLNLLARLHEHRDEFYAQVLELSVWAQQSPPAGLVFGEVAEQRDRPLFYHRPLALVTR